MASSRIIARLAEHSRLLSILGALAAGWTIYLVEGAIRTYVSSEQDKPASGSLHRSNAVHRRRRRDTTTEPEDDEPSAQHGDGELPVNPTPGMMVRQPTLTNEEAYNMMQMQVDHEQVTGRQDFTLLLYYIAQETAKNEGYIHRGITCNSCSAENIRGIRYHCANCADYDLCELCESQQVHYKTHIFYKIRIPVRRLAKSRSAVRSFYPGQTIPAEWELPPPDFIIHLAEDTGFTRGEIIGLWDQFCTMAVKPKEEPSPNVSLGINRETFDKCFVPGNKPRASLNLIHDRMFNFYDTNKDGWIDFNEFLDGLTTRKHKKEDRLKRIFRGYDIDENGFVDRKDFLRMFKSQYALMRELFYEIDNTEEPVPSYESANEFITGTRPLSAYFKQEIHSEEHSRQGEGKVRDEYGDQVIADAAGILSKPGMDHRYNDPLGDDDAAIAEMLGEFPSGDNKWTVEPDFGGEVEYHVTQEAYDELLDPIFGLREQFALDSIRDRHLIRANRWNIDQYDQTLVSKVVATYIKHDLCQEPCTISEQGFRDGIKDGSYKFNKYLHEFLASANEGDPPIDVAATLDVTPQDFQGLVNQDAGDASTSSNSPPDPTLPQNRPNMAGINPLTESEILYLAAVEAVARDDKKRGGLGRLDWEEFKTVMRGMKAERLGFVVSWADLADF